MSLGNGEGLIDEAVIRMTTIKGLTSENATNSALLWAGTVQFFQVVKFIVSPFNCVYALKIPQIRIFLSTRTM